MFDPLISAIISKPKRPSSSILGWVLAGALLLVMLYSANLTAYHAWASSFSTPNRQWHGDWSNRFFWITLVLLASEIALVIRLFRKRKRRPRVD